LRLSQRSGNIGHRITCPKRSQPSIRGGFFLLSATAFFCSPNISVERSMTSGPHTQGPSGHRAEHFPLARPLARPLASDEWGRGLLVYRSSDGASQRISAVDFFYCVHINRLPGGETLANRPARAPTQSPLPEPLPLNPSRHSPPPPADATPAAAAAAPPLLLPSRSH
jgi:hypothetical protein